MEEALSTIDEKTDLLDIDDSKVNEILKSLESDEIDPEILKLEKEILDETPPIVDTSTTTTKRKKNYLNNKDLLAEVLLSKAQGGMTHNLAVMLQTLCRRYAKKAQFASYSYNDDMQSYATLMLVKTWTAFDEKRGKNPFAFFTTCVTNSFKQYLNLEKKQATVKNETLISMGLSPSFNYMAEYEEERKNSKEGLEDDFKFRYPERIEE